ncbi:MAG: hypothetical protein HYX28_00585 [Candidatus Koribacter versatilis]|uniref:Uncharacterized protein n=1 Tax=Candidatus Korobacter versatilis TaxID=658062 RepID=A0A932A5W2_9BACT|nr:hypothetical protein [Candidatus Koribacter versatilis]
MTRRAKKQLTDLNRTRERFSSEVEKRLTKHGSKLNEGLVESAAKYYPALKKLAKA